MRTTRTRSVLAPGPPAPVQRSRTRWSGWPALLLAGVLLTGLRSGLPAQPLAGEPGRLQVPYLPDHGSWHPGRRGERGDRPQRARGGSRQRGYGRVGRGHGLSALARVCVVPVCWDARPDAQRRDLYLCCGYQRPGGRGWRTGCGRCSPLGWTMASPLPNPARKAQPDGHQQPLPGCGTVPKAGLGPLLRRVLLGKRPSPVSRAVLAEIPGPVPE
jgi:hypothetical protein